MNSKIYIAQVTHGQKRSDYFFMREDQRDQFMDQVRTLRPDMSVGSAGMIEPHYYHHEALTQFESDFDS